MARRQITPSLGAHPSRFPRLRWYDLYCGCGGSSQTNMTVQCDAAVALRCLGPALGPLHLSIFLLLFFPLPPTTFLSLLSPSRSPSPSPTCGRPLASRRAVFALWPVECFRSSLDSEHILLHSPSYTSSSSNDHSQTNYTPISARGLYTLIHAPLSTPRLSS